MWAVRMETYLDALDLWEAVEEEYEVSALLTNPTMDRMNVHKERGINKSKVKAYLFGSGHSHHFHTDHVSKVGRGDTGLPQKGVCWR